MSACAQELCRYWTGHGCACELLGTDDVDDRLLADFEVEDIPPNAGSSS